MMTEQERQEFQKLFHEQFQKAHQGEAYNPENNYHSAWAVGFQMAHNMGHCFQDSFYPNEEARFNAGYAAALANA